LGAVLLVFRSELRRRWRSWLVLVVLIAIVGGLALAAAAAGRRAASAFPRFVAAHGYDVYIFNDKPLPGLARLPGVASVTSLVIPGSGQPTCACTHAINTSVFYVNELTPTGLNRAVKLVAGRMPDPSSPDEVLASFTLQQDFGIQIGSSLRVPFYASSQRAALNNNGANVTVAPSGPTVTLHVVGIAAAEFEFPSGTGTEYDLFTTPAFARAVNHRTLEASVYLVRLRHGSADLPRFAAAITPLHVIYVSNQDTSAQAVAASIHPQAVGWWILAAFAALAGLAVVGQGLGRQSIVESEEYPKLVALGLPRRQLIVLGTTRNLMVALAGAAGAVLVALALSPLAPVGEARLAEPSPGFAFDPLVLLLGALASVGGRGPGPVALPTCLPCPSRRQPAQPIPAVVDRDSSGRRGCSSERGDRHPSRIGAGTGCRFRPGGNRAFRHSRRSHRPLCHGSVRRQPFAPDGDARALLSGLPDHFFE
jgi:hypothetical protein